jgi:hypothetical protein
LPNMILRHWTAVRSARSAAECRVPDYAAFFNFRPAVSPLTALLTRHKSYGPFSLADVPGKEGHRDHQHTCDE